MNVNDILNERGKRYGDFEDHARITQILKDEMRAFFPQKWQDLQPDQIEALDMIAHKIGRILNGDPNYIDSWDDIAGYATLVANRLRKEEALRLGVHAAKEHARARDWSTDVPQKGDLGSVPL